MASAYRNQEQLCARNYSANSKIMEKIGCIMHATKWHFTLWVRTKET